MIWLTSTACAAVVSAVCEAEPPPAVVTVWPAGVVTTALVRSGEVAAERDATVPPVVVPPVPVETPPPAAGAVPLPIVPTGVLGCAAALALVDETVPIVVGVGTDVPARADSIPQCRPPDSPASLEQPRILLLIRAGHCDLRQRCRAHFDDLAPRHFDLLERIHDRGILAQGAGLPPESKK